MGRPAERLRPSPHGRGGGGGYDDDDDDDDGHDEILFKWQKVETVAEKKVRFGALHTEMNTANKLFPSYMYKAVRRLCARCQQAAAQDERATDHCVRSWHKKCG